MAIDVQKSALAAGEPLCVRFKPAEGWPTGLYNINIDVFRLGELRDDYVYGVGQEIDLRVPQDVMLPNWPNLAAGLYKVASARVVDPNGAVVSELLSIAPSTGAIHFEVEDLGGIAAAPLSDRVAELYRRRQDAITTAVVTPKAVVLRSPFEATGVVFCVGAPVHGQQNLRGVSIVPYGSGMDYSTLRTAVNEFLHPVLGWTINHDDNVARHYSQQTPCYAIVVHRLVSADPDDGIQFLQTYAADINTILSVSKGAAPTSFAVFVANRQGCHGGFFYPHYRGNLAAPMSPSELSDQIERLIPRMSSARTRLLLEVYAEAMREPNRDFQYLRLWTLLELMAKDAVQSRRDPIVDAAGQPITAADGAPVVTSTAAPKVYKYLWDRGHGALRTADAEIPLWQLVRAAYVVRNAVAHEGAFRPDPAAAQGSPLALASEQRAQPFDFVFGFLKSATWLSVLREANA